MTSQPDKLFRDKLENFHVPAPAGAWDKLERNLSKPNRVIIWIRVAAGIALLSAATIILWPAQTTTETIAVKPERPGQQKKVIPETGVTSDSVSVPQPELVKKSDNTWVAQTEKKTQRNKTIVPEDSVLHIALPESTPRIAENVQPITPETASRKIVYSSEEVNSKFLKKKLPPQATPAQEDASGIQKLMGLAYAAKNSETGLVGSLREKKDEILALNFKSKKGEN